MVIALTFVILLAVTVSILLIRLFKPGFSYYWVIAAVSGLMVWPLIFFSDAAHNIEIRIAQWAPLSIFPSSPLLRLDQISWSFSLALATLLLSSTLTSIALSSVPGRPRLSWNDLASSVVLTAASFLGICAGNLLTLQLAWILLDLVELISFLSKADGARENQRTIHFFASRILSHIFLLWAVIATQDMDSQISVISLNQTIQPFLLLAVSARLGVFPLIPSPVNLIHLEPGFRTILSLVPTASSLVLLCRLANAGVPSEWASPYLLLVGLAGLYGGLNWIRKIDQREDPTNWIIVVGALSMIAAIQAQPAACQSLGLILILSGGLLFLFDIRPTWLLPVIFVGAINLSGFPWTPTWSTAFLYLPPFHSSLIIILVCQALTLAGYLRRISPNIQTSMGPERWVWALYIWGLTLLPLTNVIIAWMSGLVGKIPYQSHPALIESWPGLASIFLALLFFVFSLSKYQIPARLLSVIGFFLGFEWVSPIAWRSFILVRYLMNMLNTLLESQAGLLWAFLLLVLLLTLFTQSGLGG